MPKVRLLANNVADKDGNPIGGMEQVVDVDDETAAMLRQGGKAALIEDEERNIKEATEHGHYGDVTGREEVGQVSQATSHPGPQADREDEDEREAKDKKDRGKK